MAGRTPHRTPLRRVSQGSLFALSRSQHPHAEAPHGLGFLEPAISELADEMESVQVNTQGLAELSASLQSFNDSFASLLHVMRMNALTTDWNQVCIVVYLSIVQTNGLLFTGAYRRVTSSIRTADA